MDAARRLATYDDLASLPEGARAEVVRGVLLTMPAPLPRHARVQQGLTRYVGGPFDGDDGRGGPGGWWILTEVDVQLSAHDIVRPDASGWRRPRLPDPWNERPIEVVPDWVCEVISPTSAAHDRVTKRALYAAHGVPFYWIIDPVERTLEALRLVDGRWVDAGAFDSQATARVPPFDAVELELARLYPPIASDP